MEWPEEAFGRLNLNRSTAVTTLTHDPKIDDLSLRIALPPDFRTGIGRRDSLTGSPWFTDFRGARHQFLGAAW